jgi:ribosomal protein L11 methylase PrmA
MIDGTAESGSFRDPGSRVFSDGERILRAVYPGSAGDYEAFRDSGLMDKLVRDKKLVGCQELDFTEAPGERPASYLLEHPRLPFISYPYEWSFSLLRKAALLQVDLLLEALEKNITLSDATAYNIQFVGTEPSFIDHLSFRPYHEGEIWAAHRQFCMQFLNPLVLWSRRGVSPNAWYRGSLEGIEPEQLSPLLGWRDGLSWTVLTHVLLHGSLQRRAARSDAGQALVQEAKLSRASFKGILHGLRNFIGKARLPTGRTVWGQYASDNSYANAEASTKRQFVQDMVAAHQPRMLFDLGCNTGDYSVAALNAGAQSVVGFDFDFGALEQAVKRSENGSLPFLPLWLDATNPSPEQGWAQRERQGFAERARGDAVLALAFVHHLAIARNVPLSMAIDWIMAVAPVGVIEFPPKKDPMVQRLLRNRADIFPDYTEENFVAEVQQRARVVKSAHLAPGGRLLLWYDRSSR